MSPVPEVIDELLSRCRNSADLSGVQVLDGQPGVRTQDDVVIIGFSPERLTVEGEPEVGGLHLEEETNRLVCLASAATGGPAEFKPQRDRAWSFYRTVSGLVAANQRLATGVFFAATRSTAYEQQHIPVMDDNDRVISTTTAATVEFTVLFRSSL